VNVPGPGGITKPQAQTSRAARTLMDRRAQNDPFMQRMSLIKKRVPLGSVKKATSYSEMLKKLRGGPDV